MSRFQTCFSDGMPGTRGSVVTAIVRNAKGFDDPLREYAAATAAGADGSITVWRDNAANYKCGFYRSKAPLDERTFKRKKDVTMWLRVWLPKLYEFHGG